MALDPDSLEAEAFIDCTNLSEMYSVSCSTFKSFIVFFFCYIRDFFKRYPSFIATIPVPHFLTEIPADHVCMHIRSTFVKRILSAMITERSFYNLY